MPILPTRKGQDGRGTKHTFDAGQLGSWDDGEIAPNREGLLVKKTDAELIGDIRRSEMAIDTYWYEAFPLGREVDLDGLQQIESHANALAIYCKHLRKTLAEGE
jgi:hypothetical protein